MGHRMTTLSRQDIEARRRFAEQYVIDRDAYSALLRLGYNDAFARHYSAQFMSEEFTRGLIDEIERSSGKTPDEQHRERIIAALYREANNMENTASARVAALGQLARIFFRNADVSSDNKSSIGDEIDLSHLSVDDLESIKQKLYGRPAERD